MFDQKIIKSINTEEFRREAIKFEENRKRHGEGFYIDPKLKGTKEWKDYWNLQAFYCINGMSVGGVKITGEHYFYLNFCQISLKLTKKITDLTTLTELTTKKVKVDTTVTFPDFWDSDWYYFNECKRAEELGLHIIVLKPRRRGYSYKNAAKCAWTYTFSKTRANSLILAEDKKYSEETMRMAVSYLDFLNRHTGFSRQRQHINKPREMVQASYEEITPDGRKLIGGSMSRIMQYSTLNNPDVARGKDAKVILFEEAGSMSNLKATYTVTRPTVESGTAVSGQMFVYGTGGDFSGGMVDFEEMFYDPDTYGFLAYDNMYDEGATSSIGYFLPDSYSKLGFITEQGMSLHKEAEFAIQAERDHLRRTTKDINIVDKMICENPLKPSEAMDLYYIATDPFAMDKDKSKELTKRDSLGAAYVMKRVNSFSKPYDIIVAEYVARPNFQDDFNRQLFMMAEYYNAKIVFENDRGNIIEYARNNKLLYRLEEELTVYDSSNNPRRKLGRSYGVSMSNIEVKKQAVQYFRDWLLAPRDRNEDGTQELNLHKIYSIPLLEEILKFSYEGNFDRHSAMLVAMLYKKELVMKPLPETNEGNSEVGEFFYRLKTKVGLKQTL